MGGWLGKTRVEVRLRDDELSHVEHIRQVYGFDTRQEAIRFIIRQHRDMNKALRSSKSARRALSRALEMIEQEVS